MKTDCSLSKVKAPAGQALRQMIRQTGQRAADRQLSGPWPVEPFQRIIVPCRTFLLPLSVCASPDDPQHRGVSWHNIGNYDREPEGKTNPSAEIGKCLSHFARQEPRSLVRFKKQNSEDMACCACPFPCLAHL